MKYVLAIKEKDGNIKFYYDDNKYVMRLIEIDLDMCKEDEIPKADTDGGIIGRPLYFDECYMAADRRIVDSGFAPDLRSYPLYYNNRHTLRSAAF